MTLNLASLNVMGLRDSIKCTRLLGELKKSSVDVAAVQETHLTYGADCRVLESDFNVFSAYGSRTSAGISLLVGRSLDADADVVFAGDGGRLVLADVAVKSFKFGLVAVYASNIAAERISFFVGGAVPGRYEASSLNGWLECDPRSQDREGRAGS